MNIKYNKFFMAFVFFNFAFFFGCLSKNNQSVSEDVINNSNDESMHKSFPVQTKENNQEINKENTLVENSIENKTTELITNEEEKIEASLDNDDFAEQEFNGSYDDRISIKERSDYRTYVNGKYLGLTYREAELYLIQTKTGGTINYEGESFVIQDTRKNMISAIRKLDSTFPIKFKYEPASNYALGHSFQPQYFEKDSGFPLLRNFPIIPNIEFNQTHIGKTWEGKSTIIVHPKQNNPYLIVPVYVQYEYVGQTSYLGQPVHKVLARYALRNATSKKGENQIRCNGSRTADIFLSIKTQAPVFIRERTMEVFDYPDGSHVENKGTLLHFYKYEKNGIHITGTSEPENSMLKIKKEVLDKIQKNENYDIKRTKRGVQINLKNLQFKPNSHVLLSGEEYKLDQIANILKNYSTRKFFVEGHTADVGNIEEQKLLSEKRAFSVVNELIKRGIPASQFIYNGAGATKPIAPNNTDINRAKNRRVEITIMQ